MWTRRARPADPPSVRMQGRRPLCWELEVPMPPVRRGTPSEPPVPTPPAKGTRAHTARARRAQTNVQDPEQVLRRYLTWHEAEGHSRKTEEDYQKTLRPFFAYLKAEHDLADLGALEIEHLRAWLVWLRNTPTPHGRPRS